jgi:prepilin-type processing-associated H-X9-DG protein
VEEDWGEQIADIEPESPNNAEEQEAAKACRNALISIPVSYVYCAYAQTSMIEWVEASGRLVEHLWKYWEDNPSEIQDYQVADLTAVGCPDWGTSGFGTSLRVGGYDGDLTLDSYFKNRSTYEQDIDFDALPSTYPRLKEGVERFFITDINNPAAGTMGQSTIGVMWDAWGTAVSNTAVGDIESKERQNITVFNHVPGGANALFMDGHVEFVRFESGYPCTTKYEGETNNVIVYWHSSVGGFN